MKAKRAVMALGAAASVIGGAVGARSALDAAVARVEAQKNRVARPPGRPSDRAIALHSSLRIADLHADSLLWGRDLLRHGDRAHVDILRLIEGNVALETFAMAVKTPRHLKLERNEPTSDDVLLVALAKRWPPATWRSLLARVLYLAGRAQRYEAASVGRFRLIRSRADLAEYLAARSLDRSRTAGLLAIEGAHALEGDPANVEVVADAGVRMISPAHFFDTAFGGSAHGVERYGLTPAGREMLRRMEARGVLLDVAHASPRTVDDALAVATRPIVASHTGLRAIADNVRNLSDGHLRAIAETGGLVGIGFWEAACGGTDAASIARSIAYAVERVGPEHVALGSDWDGSVTVPFDAAGLVHLTDALLDAGLDEPSIRGVMGENVFRLLAEVLR